MARSRQENKRQKKNHARQMGHAFVDAVQENSNLQASRTRLAREAQTIADRAAVEERNAELDLAELTAEAIAATETAEANQAALSAATANMLGMQVALRAAHRCQIVFLKNLVAANPILCASDTAGTIQQRIQLLEQQVRALTPQSAASSSTEPISKTWSEGAEWY